MHRKYLKAILIVWMATFYTSAIAVVNFDEIPAGTWIELPGSNLSSVVPSPTPPGNTGPASVMIAWGGGAYDTERDRLIVWGGGHADYSGNEIYTFDITSQTWEMVEPPSPNSLIPSGGTPEALSDGKPVSRHTYDGLAYIPSPYDSLWNQGGSRWSSGGGTQATWQYQFSNSTWVQKVDSPSSSVLGVVSGYDSSSGKVIHRGKFALSAFDPATNSYSQLYYNSAGWWLDAFTAAVDPTRRYFVVLGGGEFSVFDLKTNTFVNTSLSGDTSIINAFAPGIAYDSVSDKMVAWNGGKDVYVLDLDTWVWTKNSASSGATPTVASDNGTYGRFQYIPSKNAFIAVNSIDENVYIYKLSPGGGSPIDSVITDVKLVDYTGTSRTDVYQTFGHIFKKGDISSSSTIQATLSDGTALLTQVDAKTTHADGSLRHAIISVLLPQLSANETKPIKLVKKALSTSPSIVDAQTLLDSGFDSVVDVTIGGKLYQAKVRPVLQSGNFDKWLEGGVATEWLLKAPLVDGSGNPHPHLMARFNIRSYGNNDNVRVDVTIENNWSYVADPQNITYDVAINLNSSNIYNKSSLTHYHHTRWHKVFWTNGDPLIDVEFNIAYMMDTRAFPNFDQSVTVAEAALSKLDSESAVADNGPMGLSIMSADMPGTGARADIGPVPQYAAFYLLSMDKRAKNATLRVGDAGGSWSIHYRDKNTDMPLSIKDYPYATLLADPPDTLNPATGKYEAFPSCGGNCSDPYNPDSAHQPSIAYVPYVVTGDYYYLEELLFWANYNHLQGNPHYREFEKGLVIWDQVRGQGWSLRTIGQAANVIPDNHVMNGYFNTLLNDNLTWFNNAYVGNSGANKLGFISNGNAIAYGPSTGIAPWQDDFVTWSVGYVAGMGFSAAKPFLDWKASFPVRRMMDSDYCWIVGAPYKLFVRDTKDSPFYATMGKAYEATYPGLVGVDCNSQEMVGQLNVSVLGEMEGFAYDIAGYPSNMQPALAVAVDSGVANASAAWSKFENRTVKPDYSHSPQWAVVPYGSKINVDLPKLPSAPSFLNLERL